MRQELTDIVFISFIAFLFLSLSRTDFIWVEGLALDGRVSKALNLTHDLTLSRGRLGKDLSAMA